MLMSNRIQKQPRNSGIQRKQIKEGFLIMKV